MCEVDPYSADYFDDSELSEGDFIDGDDSIDDFRGIL